MIKLMTKKSHTSIALVLLPEVTASTLMSLLDVFRMLGQLAEINHEFSVALAGETLAPVKTVSQVAITPEKTFDQITQCDIVIVPSLMLPDGGWPKGKYPRLIEWLKQQYASGAVICSACSGIFPILETGLFDQAPVTCHWGYAKSLRESYPDVQLQIEKTLVVAGDDKRLVMSGASGSWHDLALYLLNRFAGPSAARLASKFFLLNWHPEGQAPYITFQEELGHGDTAVAKAQAWISEHWRSANPIDSMAARSGLSDRSFKRRFKKATGLSPLDYVQHLRVERAKQYLEAGALPVDEIAARIGYEEPAFFRKLFKRITTMTPSAYRMKFRSIPSVRLESVQ